MKPSEQSELSLNKETQESIENSGIIKPNKPNINSRQPVKPGSSKISRRPPLPLNNSFELSPIINELPFQPAGRSSFKLLQFSPPSPKGRRGNGGKQRTRTETKTWSDELVDFTAETSKTEPVIPLMAPMKSWCSSCKVEVFSRVQAKLPVFPM
jgi:hypothetical protein